MRMLLALALAPMLLTGCATGHSEPVCPVIVEYPRERQARAAAELVKMPLDAEVPQMMADYGRLRDQVRACRKGA